MSKVYVAVQRNRQKKNDDLYHWKYIKKVKKNGKWRYYYDTKSLKRDVKDALGYDERENMYRAKQNYLNAQASNPRNNMFKGTTVNPVTVKGVAVEPVTVKPVTVKPVTIDGVTVKSINIKLSEATANEHKAAKEYIDAVVKYNRTPLGIIENVKKTVNTGIKWLKKKLGF